MNAQLADFLKINKSVLSFEWKKKLVSAWTSQLTSDSMSGNRGSTRVTSLSSVCSPQTEEMLSFLVDAFYENLILMIHGKSDTDNASHPTFPHYTPFGVRLTLSYLVEIFFAGEDTFANHLLLSGREENGMSAIEAEEAFENIISALRLLIEHYSHSFCEECLAPLNDTLKHIAEESRLCEYNRSPHETKT